LHFALELRNDEIKAFFISPEPGNSKLVTELF